MKPSGNVTFLFTDIEGSTKLAQSHPEILKTSLQNHNSILNSIIEINNGFVFKTIGDAFCCVFHNADEAVKAAVDIQRKLTSEKLNEKKLKVRIGIHSGIAEWNGTDYMGYVTLARANRIMSCAYGEQIIISNDAYKSLSDKIPESISFRDFGERRLKDLINPVRLFQIVSEGIRDDFPPLKTLDIRPNNLPVQLTSFIGREEEMKQIKNIIQQSPLLTLTGPGGTGKTRLALQIAAEIIDDFENGVWFTELAALTETELLPQIILQSLGVAEQSNQNPEETLFQFIKDKEMLILLDNCEHIINSVAELTEKLLSKNPKLKIIATSREALRCSGEKTHRTLSLESPDPNKNESAEKLTQYEAVQLFIERALAVNNKFRVNNENAPALAGICSQLDGIPLAIELAAARIKVLSIEKIYERLDNRFKFLTGGKRTALPRQQTLKALIDWSYDLLNEKEKILFQRLSVFSGGWTIEAAEEICSDDFIEADEIIDIVEELNNKSLITSKDAAGKIRFYMLESIRQYSIEIFIDSGKFKRKHFDYYYRMSDHVELRKEGLSQLEWLNIAESEIDNIRASIQFGLDNRLDELFEYVSNFTNFWNIKGNFSEGMMTCRKVLNSHEPESRILKAKVMYSAGMLGYGIGKISDSEKYAEESLAIFREENYPPGIIDSLNLSGIILNVSASNTEQSLKCYTEALMIARENNLKHIIPSLLYNMSFPLMQSGEKEKSMEFKIESLKLHRENKDIYNESIALANLGVIEFRSKNYEAARSYSEESLAITNLVNDKYLHSINLINLGNINSAEGNYEAALKLISESVDIAREYGYITNLIPFTYYYGDVLSKTGDYRKAAENFRESIKIGIEAGIDYFLHNNIYGLSYLYFNLKEYEKAAVMLSIVKKLLDNSNTSYQRLVESDKINIEVKLKEILGSDKFEKLTASGFAMSRDESINFTLEEDLTE